MSRRPAEPPEPPSSPIHPFFARNLAYWMNQVRLTAPQLALKAGMAKETIYALLGGRSNPSYPTALTLAAILGIHVSMLWDHRPPPNEAPRGTARS